MKKMTSAGSEERQEEAPLSYEEAFARLEIIVRKLETGDCGLDEALRLFEEGVALTRMCAQMLDKVEARINLLMNGENGPVETPFTSDLPGAAAQ